MGFFDSYLVSPTGWGYDFVNGFIFLATNITGGHHLVILMGGIMGIFHGNIQAGKIGEDIHMVISHIYQP